MIFRENGVRLALFVGRCCGASTGALWMAMQLGLSHAVWSAISALVVSQECLNETKTSLSGLIFGTIFGVAVSCGVNLLFEPYGASIHLQMGCSIAICAALTHRFPLVRVSMWTCPIVLLSAEAATPIMKVGLDRGAEVILGALIGGATHALCEAVSSRFPIDGRPGVGMAIQTRGDAEK